MAVIRNLTLHRGESWTYSFLALLDGIPITEDWAVMAQVRETATSPDPLFVWTTEAGNASLVDGVITLTLAPQDFGDFPRWALWGLLVSRDDEAQILMAGTVSVQESVVRHG